MLTLLPHQKNDFQILLYGLIKRPKENFVEVLLFINHNKVFPKKFLKSTMLIHVYLDDKGDCELDLTESFKSSSHPKLKTMTLIAII